MLFRIYKLSLSSHYYSKEHFENKKQQINSKSKIQIEDTPEVADMIGLLMHDTKDFLAYCKGRVEEISETRIDYNEDGYGLYPEDYFCLFYRFDWKKKKICRFKDHDKRRNRLYIDACIIRRIKPDVSFMELLYNLVVRRQRYYDNSDGVLTNRFLIEKVNQVLSMDISDLYLLNPSKHGVYRVDKTYCLMHGITPKSYSRVVAGRIRQNEIAKWYDSKKSLSENLAYAKNNGIKVSRKTLSKYCHDMGLNTEPMRIPPEQWYDSSISVAENLRRAIVSGIKSSKASLYRYCQEHGINPQGEGFIK